DAGAKGTLGLAYARGTMSARGHGRILRVARTIADLDGSARVSAKHVNEALGLRQDDVLDGAIAA
ncbi:MAG: Magnesium chelatase, subunit ChlI C-terminal, partial [Gaiellales bacterium]|nr:Magnesium chelatase, subunit ChlI C-terminal [Gaiellales bacterium]